MVVSSRIYHWFDLSAFEVNVQVLLLIWIENPSFCPSL